MQTLTDEGIGPIGVANISGPTVNFKHLVGLGNGTKQGGSRSALALQKLLRFQKSQGYFPVWLNLITSELKPHTILCCIYRYL